MASRDGAAAVGAARLWAMRSVVSVPPLIAVAQGAEAR